MGAAATSTSTSQPGEAFGIVGANGSGKSTLLKLLAGIFAPSTGELPVGGRVGSLIEIGAGFHPEFTGRRERLPERRDLRAQAHYVDEHLDEIISSPSSRPSPTCPCKTYSSGMYMRLGFSVAMHVQPDVLLLDEVLAVGRRGVPAEVLRQDREYKRGGGTIVFVSHDQAAVERSATGRSCSSTAAASRPGRRATWFAPTTGGS